MNSDEIMTERECAMLVKVDEKTIGRARRNGKPIFPYVMIGDMPKYSRTVVLAQFAMWPTTVVGAKDPAKKSDQKPGRPRMSKCQ